jgi:pimeloyl-ACP methyl ester carboxylesterase
MSQAITQNIEYPCSYDGTLQPARALRSSKVKQPLLVILHPWSHGYEVLNMPKVEQWCLDNDWNLIHPHFRGPSWNVLSCGHDAAVQDIVDAVRFGLSEYKADSKNVFLTGISGGGFHTMLMTGRHPELFRGTSSWVGISDIKAWHLESTKRRYGYDGHIEKVCGGNPQVDEKASAEALRRSAISYLKVGNPIESIEISAGIHDGHTGSVPISQSIHAYNALVGEEARVSQELIGIMTETATIPPEAAFADEDPTFGSKKILFRRKSGNVRLNIFEGGHEGVESAIIAWLSNFE